MSWEYPPLIEGGLARVVRKQAEGLVERDAEVHVLTRGGEESPAEELVNGVHVHRVREPTRPAELNEFVAWVERMNSDMLAAGVELGDRLDFDIVHGHDWLVANACDHLARRFRSPLVTTIHATEHGRHQGWVDKHPQSYIHGVERWITNRSDRVLVCSTFMREQVVDVFGVDEDRVEVIPNGIDPEDLQPHDDDELRRLRAEFAEPDESLVLLVGRLVYEKGFQFALEALPEIIERLPNTRFVVAGSGTHEEELRRQAEELGLMEHGTFVGWIGDDVLHSLYRIADVCVVPSIYEPFGLVALEAMASSCPCIVADTGGLREVVPHDEVGLRFRARDPVSLAEMTVRVLDDAKLCRRLTAEAFEHLRRFDWGDVAERTADVYAELDRNRGARAGRMTRLPEGRREVYPSRGPRPKRRAPDFGPGLNVSVPISFGLPLVVVGHRADRGRRRVGRRDPLGHRRRRAGRRRPAVRVGQAALAQSGLLPLLPLLLLAGLLLVLLLRLGGAVLLVLLLGLVALLALAGAAGAGAAAAVDGRRRVDRGAGAVVAGEVRVEERCRRYAEVARRAQQSRWVREGELEVRDRDVGQPVEGHRVVGADVGAPLQQQVELALQVEPEVGERPPHSRPGHTLPDQRLAEQRRGGGRQPHHRVRRTGPGREARPGRRRRRSRSSAFGLRSVGTMTSALRSPASSSSWRIDVLAVVGHPVGRLPGAADLGA